VTVIQHDYKPNPTQIKFHSSNRKYKGFKGSKGSGKTRALVEEVMALNWEFPGNRGIVARKDFRDLKETTYQFFEEYYPKELILDRNEGHFFWLVRSKDPSNPSRIKFSHCKDPKSFESGEIGYFAFDEADEIPEETFKVLRTRLRRKGIALYGLMAFNPTDDVHWLYRFFVEDPIEKDREDRELFSNNTFENAENLPNGYIDELKDTYKNPEELKRYLYGEWGSVSSDRAVYPSFAPEFHISQEPIEFTAGAPLIRCHDFGMYAACSFMQIVNGQLRILAPEIMEFGKGAEQFAPIVLQKSLDHFGVPHIIDVSEPYATTRSTADASLTCASVYRRHGITLKIGRHSFAERISAVEYFLSRNIQGEPALIVDKRCKMICSGFKGGYRFEASATERRGVDVEDNEYTHLADTVQFGACFALGKISQMRQGPMKLKAPRYEFSHD